MFKPTKQVRQWLTKTPIFDEISKYLTLPELRAFLMLLKRAVIRLLRKAYRQGYRDAEETFAKHGAHITTVERSKGG